MPISPQIALMLFNLLDKYGPDIASAVAELFKKGEITIEEVMAIFAQVRTYESFGIPDKVPPGSPGTAPTPVAALVGTFTPAPLQPAAGG
jgi:hypothetical protein